MASLRIAIDCTGTSTSQYGVSDLLWFGQYPWQGQDELVDDTVSITRCNSWRDVSQEIERLERD